MKILFFDCFSGISGDMALGALLDLTCEDRSLLNELKKTGFNEEWDLKLEKISGYGITGCNADVIIKHHGHKHEGKRQDGHVHRGLGEIKRIIDASGLNKNVKSIAVKVFEKLADAEAKVHGIDVEKVHFHEVGAVDAIIDIIGVSILIDIIKPDKIMCSPVNTGSGSVKCAHGVLPVPAPATAELLKGFDIYSSGINFELTTPTGAAILKTLCQKSRALPEMRLLNTGYGFGKRDTGGLNALRVFLGEIIEQTGGIFVLETNIDDMTGEALGAAMDIILEEGALEAYFTPVYMKKQRPSYLLSVLCQKEDKEKFEKLIFKHTSTIGIRNRETCRAVLERREQVVDTSFGRVKVKYSAGYGISKLKPAYEDILRISKEKSLSFDEIYRAVTKELE